MNYKKETIRAIQDMMTTHSTYSLGEIFYTISRELKIKNKRELLEKTDQEIYYFVNKAKYFEKDIEVSDAEFVGWIESK